MKQLLILSSYVVDSAKSNVGFNYKFLRLASESCEEVVFVTSNYPEEALKDLKNVETVNIPIHWSGISQKRDLLHYFKMQWKDIRYIRKYGQQGVPVIFWLSGPMLLPFLYCKLTKRQTVVFLYGNTKYKDQKPSHYNSLISHIMSFMAKHATKIGVESPSVLPQWRLAPKYEKKVIYFHLYVDYDFSKRPQAGRTGKKIVGMACRLQANKHPLDAIDAFHGLEKEFPQWHLEIAGNGPDYQICCDRIRELGAEQRIHMLGWIDNRQIQECYDRWSLLLFPRNYEGLPNSVIESMCSGTPVLASPVGGIPDILRDGKNGWFLHGTTAEDIQSALRSILTENQMADFGREAQRYALKEFSYNHALTEFQRLFL